jgi:hypothetical protein
MSFRSAGVLIEDDGSAREAPTGSRWTCCANLRARGGKGQLCNAQPRRSGTTGSFAPTGSGKWVALRDGELVDARDTLDALVTSLDAREIKNVTVMRAPAEGEAEMVGLD